MEHPGHGGAPLADVRTVADLARLALEQVAAGRFSFVGLSLGGAIGMQLALESPHRLDKLVLCSTATHFGETYRERAAIVRARGLEAVVATVLERWFTPSFADVRRYREMFLSTDAEGYARCCEALAEWDVRGCLGRVRVPTLCIAADDDPVTPPAALEAIAAEIPGARVTVIPDGRHLTNVERATEFNAALFEHL